MSLARNLTATYPGLKAAVRAATVRALRKKYPRGSMMKSFNRVRLLRASALLASAIVFGATNAHAAADVSGSNDRAAIAVMDAFLSAFNARDEAAWADSLHFPHVRLASQSVTVYPDRAAFLAAMDLDQFAASSGWRYSTWDDMSVIQSSPNKVHIKVKFSRFNARDELLASFDSLYVIEKIDDRWGVRARSSFAP